MSRRRGNRVLLGVAALLVAAGLSSVRSSSSAANQVNAGATTSKIFFLNIRGQVLSANTDGSDRRVLVDGLTTSPDGIAVDVANGHIYWSNMGAANADDGSIVRSNLDGSNVTTIVPAGGTFTAKQLKLDEVNRQLYWSDREGMRVQRVNLDGTGLETIVEVAKGADARRDAANWCVGIAVDAERGHVYWTQKGADNEGRGSIRRAGLNIPRGQTAANRTDVEVLFDALPEPIDLDLDLMNRQIYWTDRGDAPRGNTVNRAPMDPPAGFHPARRTDAKILASNFNETIGVALDLPRGMMYITDLRGSLYSTKIDGSERRVLGSGLGSLTGIAFVELPAGPRQTN